MAATEPGFTGFSPDTLDFFRELEKNNNKPWFEENRERFIREVKTRFEDLAEALIPTISEIDPALVVSPRRAVSRIYRDMRFSRDKSPYRPVMWISFKGHTKNWQSYPVYFFELTQKAYRYGMGFYCAKKTYMDRYREGIIQNPGLFSGTFNRIIDQGPFSMEGDEYKRTIPNNLPEDLQTWFNRKNIYFVCKRSIDDIIFTEKLVPMLHEDFILLKPVYRFLAELNSQI